MTMSFFWRSLAGSTRNSKEPLEKALKNKTLPNKACYSDIMKATLLVLLGLLNTQLYGHILYRMIHTHTQTHISLGNA